jgi:hypothetical protein
MSVVPKPEFSPMADVLAILPNAVLVANATSKLMPYTEAIDVSAYKSIDCQIDIQGNAPKGVTILTSMNRDSNDASWVDAGTLINFTAGTAANVLQVPATGKALFRFIRWKIDNIAGANNATVAIIGLARTI